MITIDEFISKLEKEFEEMKPGTLKPNSNYREMENWSSMHALIIIAFIDAEFNILLKGDDLRSTQTINDLYELVKNKTQK